MFRCRMRRSSITSVFRGRGLALYERIAHERSSEARTLPFTVAPGSVQRTPTWSFPTPDVKPGAFHSSNSLSFQCPYLKALLRAI